MTMMLASVTGPDEAEIAIAGGADIIDLKDPAAGALGALPAARIAATIAAIKGRRPVERGDRRPSDAAGYRRGGSPGDRRDGRRLRQGRAVSRRQSGPTCCASWPASRSGRASSACVFADRERDLAELIAPLADAGFAGLMLDTAGQGRGPAAGARRYPRSVRLREGRTRARPARRAGRRRWKRRTCRASCRSSPISSAFAARSAPTATARAGIDLDAVTGDPPAHPAPRRLASRPMSTTACFPRAAITPTPPSASAIPSASSCAISCCRSGSAPTATSATAPQKVRFDVTRGGPPPARRAAGHGAGLFLRPHHRRHRAHRGGGPRRLRRDARRADRRAGAARAARPPRDGEGREARDGAGRRRRGDRPWTAPEQEAEQNPVLAMLDDGDAEAAL